MKAQRRYIQSRVPFNSIKDYPAEHYIAMLQESKDFQFHQGLSYIC